MKKKYGKGLCKSDIILEGATTFKLLSGGLLGSWIGVTFGLGGGIVFNPIQIAMGVNPIVASSTSMYMIIYSSAASTIVYLTYGTLEINFALWLSFWSSVGIMIGNSVI